MDDLAGTLGEPWRIPHRVGRPSGLHSRKQGQEQGVGQNIHVLSLPFLGTEQAENRVQPSVSSPKISLAGFFISCTQHSSWEGAFTHTVSFGLLCLSVLWEGRVTTSMGVSTLGVFLPFTDGSPGQLWELYLRQWLRVLQV